MNKSRLTPPLAVPVNFLLPGDIHSKAKLLAYKRGMKLRTFMIDAIAKEANAPAKRKGESA
jgi:hypothetical protein